MRILVIDDDVTMLWSLCNALRRWGSKVEAATGARAGLRMLEKQEFDVVIADYRMPDHDGLWLIKHAHIPSHTKVIVMSAYVDAASLRELKGLGVGELLEKPFSEDELQARLEKVSQEATLKAQHERRDNAPGLTPSAHRRGAVRDRILKRPRIVHLATPHAA